MKSYAKINLYLDIVGKDLRSGYHYISSIFYRVENLFDEIEFKLYDGKFNIEIVSDSNSKFNIPLGENNSCYIAANFLYNMAIAQKKNINIKPVKIIINKQIPLMAGLGGGSSNIATTLLALNKLWNLNFSITLLQEIAQKISMDSVFFLHDYHYALVEGFGEKIIEIKSNLTLNVEIKNTGVEISTEKAYLNLDLNLCNKGNIQNMINAIQNSNKDYILKNLHNDFELTALQSYPQLQNYYTKYENNNIILAGSGGCVALIS